MEALYQLNLYRQLISVTAHEMEMSEQLMFGAFHQFIGIAQTNELGGCLSLEIVLANDIAGCLFIGTA